jgi:hypothetical protein
MFCPADLNLFGAVDSWRSPLLPFVNSYDSSGNYTLCHHESILTEEVLLKKKVGIETVALSDIKINSLVSYLNIPWFLFYHQTQPKSIVCPYIPVCFSYFLLSRLSWLSKLGCWIILHIIFFIPKLSVAEYMASSFAMQQWCHLVCGG